MHAKTVGKVPTSPPATHSVNFVRAIRTRKNSGRKNAAVNLIWTAKARSRFAQKSRRSSIDTAAMANTFCSGSICPSWEHHQIEIGDAQYMKASHFSRVCR